MKRKLKGISLQIEAIVIIAICIIVLAIIILFFPSIFNPATSAIISEGDLEKECMEWQKYDYNHEYFSEVFYPKLKAKFNNASAAELYCTSISKE